MKITKVKHPKMVQSKAIKARLRDEMDMMADGGEVKEEGLLEKIERKAKQVGDSIKGSGVQQRDISEQTFLKTPTNSKAEGGIIEDMEEEPSSIAGAIMARKERRKRMATGGMVDIEENNEEQSGILETRNQETLKENYDSELESMMQPMDSNEHSEEINSDEHDMVSQIRKKIRSKLR